MNNLKPVNILEPGRGGGKYLSYRSLQERKEGLEAFKTSLKRRSRRRMRRRRRRIIMMSRILRGRGGQLGGGGGHVPFATCFLHLQLLLHQEEVKQPHTQRPNIMKYLGPPESPDHLPITTLPCLPEQCNHCERNFYKKKSV